jgi:methylmalonyl-CoA mutase cobalamin-binding domain/chain
MAEPIRLLTAVPICDGHDSAINTINIELVRNGIEVVYLGYHRSARDIVRAAIQEDVRAIGISSYNGGHVEFFAEVIGLLKKQGAAHIGVFGGGGGTITRADAAIMRRKGVARIFFAGTPLAEIIQFVKETYAKQTRHMSPSALRPKPHVSHPLPRTASQNSGSRAPVCIGITGPGGAGKTTLIDELVLRFLKADAKARIGILSHDPSIVGKGALLGDRATMIHSQDDRVFMRSLATRGRAGGFSRETARWLRAMKVGGFDAVFVETVGIGQEALPFRRGLVDKSILVMSPDYGSRLQLQKIAMLDAADIVVVNKGDLAGAATALAEIEERLGANHRGQRVIGAVARRHRDPGVDRLYEEIRA